MFRFKLEPDIPLLTVTRSGIWSPETVMAYEPALRRELAALHEHGAYTAFIIDIRSTEAQPSVVADGLRAMVVRLGALRATRTAIVASSGIAKLQAARVADGDSRVFTSIVLARDWVMRRGERVPAGIVHDEPSEATAEGRTVHVQGPSDVEVSLTPGAALETAKRIEHAAIDALLTEAPVPKIAPLV